MDKSLEVLQKYWGYTSFRPLQRDIIEEVLSNRDVLALMPTGGGKSITYQVPGIQLDGLCVVISPLIALIKDQVEDLRSRDIDARYIVSGMDYREIDRILDNAVFGEVKFLYVSPERLKTELFIERFKRMKVSLIAVDEAHCISQWGYDFRPAYLEIAKIREFHPKVPILALTASATPDAVDDIQDRLLFKKRNLLSTSFNRENLHYVVINEDNKRERILKGLQARTGSGIIYVRSRKLTRELAQWLMSMGISAAAYHAGLDPEVKDQIQRDWKKEKTRIIVATNAFGMGIDKANVRTVIHFDIPDSIEAYFQEAGRAGRDGLRAFAVLVYNNADLLSLMERIGKAFPPIEIIKKVYTGICTNYKLAYGSGINQSFVFDIIALSEVIKIPVLDVFNSLKILERVGYIQLSESLHKPSRLKIKVSQSDLYYFEVANPKFELLLKTLLRSYSGLFDNHVVVNEYLIAKRVQTNVEDLLKQLKYLDKIELLEYLPASDKPQITFLVERLPEDRLTISYESYGALKKKQLERGRSMTKFVSSSKCRHVQLLEYFGEKDVKNCGKCDVCLKSKTTSAENKVLENKVKSLIQQGGKTIEMILSELAIKDEEQIIEIIRYFADEGLIQRDSNNFWKWVA